jgi:hypothetical protein
VRADEYGAPAAACRSSRCWSGTELGRSLPSSVCCHFPSNRRCTGSPTSRASGSPLGRHPLSRARPAAQLPCLALRSRVPSLSVPAHVTPRWVYAVYAAAAGRVVPRMDTEGGTLVRELMHTTETNLAHPTLGSDPEPATEQVRHRSARGVSLLRD